MSACAALGLVGSKASRKREVSQEIKHVTHISLAVLRPHWCAGLFPILLCSAYSGSLWHASQIMDSRGDGLVEVIPKRDGSSNPLACALRL